MNNATLNKLTKKLSKIKNKVVSIAAGAVSMVYMYTDMVYAAGGDTGGSGTGDTSSIIAPLTNLKTLVIAIIGAVGVIILAKNVMEFSQAYQQQDSSTMNSALKGIVSGILMAGISTVLAFLGF